MRTSNDWHALLAKWNALLLADEEVTSSISPDKVHQGWLGYEPASDDSLRQAERRLGVVLPPTYRTFLQTSNGWQCVGPFIARARPVEEVEWFVTENREWADIHIDACADLERISEDEYLVYGDRQDPTSIRPEYLLSALQISDVTESTVLLLNPEIQTPEGEWEAWFFAAWAGGADRYPSFWDLMADKLRSYQVLRGK
jgi:hypothetical protein